MANENYLYHCRIYLWLWKDIFVSMDIFMPNEKYLLLSMILFIPTKMLWKWVNCQKYTTEKYIYMCPFKIPNSMIQLLKLYSYKNIYGYCARWSAELIGGAVGTSCIGTYIVPTFLHKSYLPFFAWYLVTLLPSYLVTLLSCYSVTLWLCFLVSLG